MKVSVTFHSGAYDAVAYSGSGDPKLSVLSATKIYSTGSGDLLALDRCSLDVAKGEIVTIVARQSDAYHDVALHWAVLGMLLALAVLATWPGLVETLHTLVADPWEGAPTIRAALTAALIVAAGCKEPGA